MTRVADHIFSNDRWASAHYHRENVWHLPVAAGPTYHKPINQSSEGTMLRDVFFCGVGFSNRTRLLQDLSGALSKVHTEVFGDEWDLKDLPFVQNHRIPNDQLREYYSSSRIVLNIGRDFSYANRKYQLVPSTPGPRTFEAAMAGACQMMFVDSLEIMDYFSIDSEIVLFDGPGDFENKLTDLLNNSEKRNRIGAAARERCLKDHTYAARAREILSRIGLVRLDEGESLRGSAIIATPPA
jgi:spore maturation protein CgeB